MHKMSSLSLSQSSDIPSSSETATSSVQSLEQRVQCLTEQLTETQEKCEQLQQSQQAYKQIEAAVQNSEARYQSIIATANDAFVGMDNQGYITEWNQQAEALFGWPRAAILGQMLEETVIPERYRQAHHRGLQHFLATGEGRVLNKRIELAALHRDGHEFPIEITIWANLTTEQNYQFYAFIHDISPRKQAEAAIKALNQELEQRVNMRTAELLNANQALQKEVAKRQQAESSLQHTTERLSLALSAAKIGLWSWNTVTQAVTWDECMHSLFGMAPGEFAGTYDAFMRCVHEEDREPLSQAIQYTLQAKAPFDTQYRVVWPDRSIHMIAARGEAFQDNLTGTPYILGACWEITKQKQFEQERLEALQQAEEYQRGRAQDAEKYQHQFEDFINLICHEIRNPLNGFMGSIEWLKEARQHLESALTISNDSKYRDNTQAALKILNEAIDTNQECASHQLSIVNDVLDLSKLEANQLQLSQIPFAPENIIHCVVKMYQSKLAEKKLALKLHLPNEKVWVKSDPARLKMILINLLTNAIKFTPAGTITLGLQAAVQEQETELLIQVKDTGIGMTQDEQSQLFQRFTQVGHRQGLGGSGLGLCISKNLALLMGGDIQVESEVGQGSVFTVRLCCKNVTEQEKDSCKNPAAIMPSLSPINTLSSNQKILIVEDNPMNQKILSSMLGKQGYSCQLANDGVEAVTLAKSTHFDLIFMDMQMPHLDGLEATRRIRQHEHEMQTASVPIIGLSGYATEASRQSALEAGMNDYLTKPFIRTDLNAKLAYWLTQMPATTIEPETNPISAALPFFTSSPSTFLEERLDLQNVVIFTRH